MSEYASLRGKIRTLIIDNTLTIPGAIADAKAVGDVLNNIEEAVKDIEIVDGESVRSVIESIVGKEVVDINSAIDELREDVDNAATTETHRVTVDVGDWSVLASGLYCANKSVVGLLAGDNPIIDIILGADMEANKLFRKQWGFIEYAATDKDILNIYASDAPVCAFTMQVKVVR